MKILLARPRGFCAGVERAIQIVELSLQRFGPPIYVRHEIVHNRTVVQELTEKGVVFIEKAEDAPPGSVLIFSAHGVSPMVRQKAEESEHRTIDATCPLVTKVHSEAKRHAKQEADILLVGHAGHVEVEGTMGEAPDRIRLLETVEDARRVEVLDPDRVAVLTQTTLSVDDTREVIDALRDRFPALSTPEKADICYATQNRQDAVKELAKHSDLVLVVGSGNSSNGMRLVETALRLGTRVERVENAAEIDPAWFDSAECVGVTAGAAVPERLVEGVVDRLCALDGGRVEVSSLPAVDERIRFQLPKLLRNGLD